MRDFQVWLHEERVLSSNDPSNHHLDTQSHLYYPIPFCGGYHSIRPHYFAQWSMIDQLWKWVRDQTLLSADYRPVVLLQCLVKNRFGENCRQSMVGQGLDGSDPGYRRWRCKIDGIKWNTAIRIRNLGNNIRKQSQQESSEIKWSKSTRNSR